MKKVILVLFASLAMYQIFAQRSSSNIEITTPIWIEMMNSSTVNYYEAVKAFDLFWLNKQKPIEEHEIFAAEEDNERKKILIETRKLDQNSEAKRYAIEYKKFKHWQHSVEPFVKEDGSIMTKEERLLLWKQQREARK